MKTKIVINDRVDKVYINPLIQFIEQDRLNHFVVEKKKINVNKKVRINWVTIFNKPVDMEKEVHVLGTNGKVSAISFDGNISNSVIYRNEDLTEV